jgi:hypothetical protein
MVYVDVMFCTINTTILIIFIKVMNAAIRSVNSESTNRSEDDDLRRQNCFMAVSTYGLVVFRIFGLNVSMWKSVVTKMN